MREGRSVSAALLIHHVLAGLVRTSTGLIPSVPVLPESVWRPAAEAHKRRVLHILQEGFVNEEIPVRFRRQQVPPVEDDGFRKLNSRHAVFNFLHDYYNIRGAKGTRRLGRWSSGLGHVTLLGATAADIRKGMLSPIGCEVTSEGVDYNAEKHFRSADPAQATPFMWYHQLLAATERAEPILHCYNLHEWAMQYWPEGAAPPPSRHYQEETMPLRVTQDVINDVIQTQGVRCTHVDALRFFAPAAGPLNHHGSSIEREAQLRLEQPGCVHAHMDLLKISLRLAPWLPAELSADALELALSARRLDVAASPYDASKFGITPIPVETDAGRVEFRRRQTELMARAAPLRANLFSAYEVFLKDAFGEERLSAASPKPERYALAEPGGLPWRRNLIDKAATSPAQYCDDW